MASEIFKIKVYDKEFKVVKECEAVDCRLKFGVVRKVMALLKIDNIEDTAALFSIIYDAWDELTEVLSLCFPDMTDEDWDNVMVDELIPTIISIVKVMGAKMLSLPAESKN